MHEKLKKAAAQIMGGVLLLPLPPHLMWILSMVKPTLGLLTLLGLAGVWRRTAHLALTLVCSHNAAVS